MPRLYMARAASTPEAECGLDVARTRLVTTTISPPSTERRHQVEEAPQAAPLVKILNSSPLFENATIQLQGPATNGKGETFQIRAIRRYPPQ